jgi:DHA2 family multidrug resistance protein-like MFS transporter
LRRSPGRILKRGRRGSGSTPARSTRSTSRFGPAEAALAALCFDLAGREGATVALVLGAAFAAGCVMSGLRLIAKAQ